MHPESRVVVQYTPGPLYVVENWKPMRGCEGAYEVSDLGRVRSLSRKVNCRYNSLRPIRGCVLRPVTKSNGYLAVNITYGGRRQVSLHRAVLEAFVGPAPEGMEACHNNGVRTDCRLSNLRWDTRRNNHADKIAHGTAQRGSNNGNANLTEYQVLAIRSGWVGKAEAMSLWGVSDTNYYRIKNYGSWRHVA